MPKNISKLAMFLAPYVYSRYFWFHLFLAVHNTFIRLVCVYVCLVPSRVASASDVKNDDDDDDDSDSEIIRRLQAAKETELKKSDFGSFCSC